MYLNKQPKIATILIHNQFKTDKTRPTSNLHKLPQSKKEISECLVQSFSLSIYIFVI